MIMWVSIHSPKREQTHILNFLYLYTYLTVFPKAHKRNTCHSYQLLILTQHIFLLVVRISAFLYSSPLSHTYTHILQYFQAHKKLNHGGLYDMCLKSYPTSFPSFCSSNCSEGPTPFTLPTCRHCIITQISISFMVYVGIILFRSIYIPFFCIST